MPRYRPVACAPSGAREPGCAPRARSPPLCSFSGRRQKLLHLDAMIPVGQGFSPSPRTTPRNMRLRRCVPMLTFAAKVSYMNWQVDAAIASIVSAMAVVTSTIFLVVQLRQAARERYFEITAHLFQIWQSTEFQDDQLFLLHKLPASTWEEFVANGRGERAERALHRVGGFYDRIGSLIRRKLIRDEDMLPTIGGVAIAVWQRIEPFVVEARRRENAFLFQNFEAMLPECRECYVPVATDTAATPVKDVDLVEPDVARRLLGQNAAVMLDVSRDVTSGHITGAVRTTPNDLTGWLAAIKPGKDVITYCT